LEGVNDRKIEILPQKRREQITEVTKVVCAGRSWNLKKRETGN